jgi:hypothetical protein
MFSASPFTRAHMTEPFSVLSVLLPETKMNVIAGFTRASEVTAAFVMSTVTRRYSGSFRPADVTPGQKKHAVAPAR